VLVRTRKVDVVDDYHGTNVADPYRWLEDSESEEVRAWTDEQNARTRAVIAALASDESRAALRARIEALLEIGFTSPPAVRKGRYFHQRRVGRQLHPILYVRDGVSGEDRVLLDPATLSEDGTTALDWWYPSRDGALLAWGSSEGGTEESTLRVRDVATGADLADRIPFTQHASVAWLPDGRSFYYTRHATPGSVPPGDEKYVARIHRHVLGEDYERDVLVFGEGRDKLDMPSVDISPGGRWLVARVHRGWERSEIYVRDLSRDGDWIAIARGTDALFEPIALDDRMLVLTNEGAPRYRLMEVDYARPERAAWREILPEREDVLSDVVVGGGAIVAAFLRAAQTRIERFTPDGKSLGPVELPSIGSASVHAEPGSDDVFVGFTSYTTPYEVHRLDGAKLALWERVDRFTPPEVRVRVMHATSKDGTRVPMFVIDRPGTEGARPTLLYGYGGFNMSLTPAFSARTLLFIERGGVWVNAILRGGGELGEEWHRAGMLEKKQNVFDDFIACAEELVASGVTAPNELGVMGGSNGGLLVAAAVTQRPDLFRVGMSFVPLTDMLRYHRFRIGSLWIPEYGSADDPEAFAYLRAYSPYHRVVDGMRYPAMMFTSAEGDSRVDPMHARKMAARMQEAQAIAGADGERPIVLRVEAKAGHGAGKPTTQLAEEATEELAFLFAMLRMD